MNQLFNLHKGEEEKSKVLDNVKQSVSFAGANFWILACAILIASIGLNVNSTAVVIGAMLISPLMGPIIGAGFALGTYDFTLLRKSLKNLLVSTLVGLLVSFLYFLVTPYKEAQSEILSRIAPNIYDVLIAFFGGLVGVIAITRVEKGNPIPGVAIATALMPPLCTAGFGLATGEFSYFGGAIFLYVINCVFICISTYIIVKYLRYPHAEIPNSRKISNVRNWITILTLLIVIPSIYFAYIFIEQQNFYGNVSEYIAKEFEEKGNTIVYKKTYYSSNPKKIELAFLTRRFSASQIQEENKKLKDYGIENTVLLIRQDSTFFASASKKENNEVSTSVIKIASELNSKIDKYNLNTENLFKESKALFPTIKTISASKQEVFTQKDSIKLMPTVVYSSENKLSEAQTNQFRNWLKVKFKVDTLEIYYKE